MTDIFEWNGVKIDPNAREVTVNGCKYTYSQVLEWNVEYHKSCFGHTVGGVITFNVDDLQKPVHKVKVSTVFGKIEENYQRINLMLNHR